MRKLHELIIDDLYPKSSDNQRIRNAVRGIIINDKNEVALIHMKGKDAFGDRDHYELPGGGIEENEDFHNALRREIIEEIGYEIEGIKELGIIPIEYNLLNRVDVQHYFVASTTSFVGTNLTSDEVILFDKVVYIPIAEIVEVYEKYPVANVGINIHKRDLLAIKEAIKLLEQKK